jgi:hypothetical protein
LYASSWCWLGWSPPALGESDDGAELDDRSEILGEKALQRAHKGLDELGLGG